MSQAQRVVLAIALVLVDLVVIVVPLAAVFAAYVIVTRPKFFQDWVNQLYGTS